MNVTPKMNYEYNLFFYANACHVCKSFGDRANLRRCANCRMISYCCKKHQRQHWPQHKDLCTAISDVVKDNKVSDFLNVEQKCSPERWTQIKMNFMLLVGIKITRRLEYYEEQMFKFLRACAICHEQNPKILEDCPNCPNTSFCMRHKNDINHKDVCPLLRLCFNLDVRSMTNERRLPDVDVQHQTLERCLPNNMKDFIECYVKSETILQSYLEEEMVINAEHLTRPLTLLHTIERLRCVIKDDHVIVHIIAANMVEIDGIELWEILLHWLPSITTLRVVLIGPELFQGSISINLCNDCLCKSKLLSIKTYGSLYENYVNDVSFVKPDFIIAYNAGIHECEDLNSEKDTWAPSLRAVAEQNCPFMLTSYTLQEAEKEQERLKVVLGNNVDCTYCARNPYSSLRPYRDFETEGIYYQNQYIIVYEQL